jgi:hypothetical protein
MWKFAFLIEQKLRREGFRAECQRLGAASCLGQATRAHV